MKIESIVIGELKENCYLLEKNDKYLLVDPGEGLDDILEFICGKEIIGVLVTHHHYDHIGSLEYFKDKYPIYQYDNLEEGVKKIGPFIMEIIFTPGHSMDSVCYFFKEDKIMITGDFLFKGTIGRCDLEGGNYSLMKESINKIKEYGDDIMIYPGHGKSSRLGNEKKYNVYFR